MKKNNTESGRSMVEMLGVLAIMAVLSVIALYGYRIAMTKMRANELIYEANKRAISVASQLQTGATTASLNEFVDNDFGYASFSTEPVNTDNSQFKIGINGVAQDICGQMKGTAGLMIRAFEPDSCGETNTVYLTYNNDLSMDDTVAGGAGQQLPTCPDGQEAYDGNCVTRCASYQNRDINGNCQDVICALNANIYTEGTQVCLCPEHRDTTDGICGYCTSSTS